MTTLTLVASEWAVADVPSEARIHLAVAERLYSRGYYRDALTRYRKAYELVKNPDIVVEIGKCQMALHQWDDAVETFSEYLRGSRPSPSRNAVKKLLVASQEGAARARVVEQEKAAAAALLTRPRVEVPRTRAERVVAEGVGLAPVFGALVNVGLPGANRLYTYAGMAIEIPKGTLTWSPALFVQWAPDGNRWGLAAALTVNVGLSDRFGIDLTLEIGHDQAGAAFNEAAYFAGGGAGVSVYIGHWTLTPFTGLLRGLNYTGWDVSLGLNVARKL